jgi:regulation of enolase protein 1 (concanavalin A-like superfamily)
LKWFNEPSRWEVQPDGAIELNTSPKTDFWQITHYDFVRDNGHFYYEEVEGDFIAEVKILGKYQDLYDQAGLMVRLDASNWLKCGIEFVDGLQKVSAVNTRDFSDWSVVPIGENPPAIYLRVIRERETLEAHYSFDGENYTLLRLGYLKPGHKLMVGVMAASPDGGGFPVRFERLSIKQN